jgi:hypothetical protein
MLAILVSIQLRGNFLLAYPPPRARIGRTPLGDVVIDEDLIARHHADLELRDGVLWLVDANSSGGIYLEGERISAAPLAPDAELPLGSARLRAWLEDIPEPSATELALARGSPDREVLEALALRGGDLARAVAANPFAPSALLAHLAAMPDSSAQRAAAGNPSLPQEALRRLAPRYPEQFWSNPQVDFLILEDPQLTTFSSYALCSLLSSPHASATHLRHFLAHPAEVVRDFARRALDARGVAP